MNTFREYLAEGVVNELSTKFVKHSNYNKKNLTAKTYNYMFKKIAKYMGINKITNQVVEAESAYDWGNTQERISLYGDSPCGELYGEITIYYGIESSDNSTLEISFNRYNNTQLKSIKVQNVNTCASCIYKDEAILKSFNIAFNKLK